MMALWPRICIKLGGVIGDKVEEVEGSVDSILKSDTVLQTEDSPQR